MTVPASRPSRRRQGPGPLGPYRRLLERHLRETHGHAAAIGERLGALGAAAGLVTVTIGAAETLSGQVLTLAKGPLDLLRGHGGEEKLLKNAKDECATEALEIATYDTLEALADAIGDTETARMAAAHRADEERMLADLRALIPRLTRATVAARAGGEPSFDETTAAASPSSRPPSVSSAARDVRGARALPGRVDSEGWRPSPSRR